MTDTERLAAHATLRRIHDLLENRDGVCTIEGTHTHESTVVRVKDPDDADIEYVLTTVVDCRVRK